MYVCMYVCMYVYIYIPAIAMFIRGYVFQSRDGPKQTKSLQHHLLTDFEDQLLTVPFWAQIGDGDSRGPW